MYDLYDTHFAILAYFALIFSALLQLFYYFFHVVFVYNWRARLFVLFNWRLHLYIYRYWWEVLLWSMFTKHHLIIFGVASSRHHFYGHTFNLHSLWRRKLISFLAKKKNNTIQYNWRPQMIAPSIYSCLTF